MCNRCSHRVAFLRNLQPHFHLHQDPLLLTLQLVSADVEEVLAGVTMLPLESDEYDDGRQVLRLLGATWYRMKIKEY